MNIDLSGQIAIQVLLAATAWLGILLGWLPGYRGIRRIRQPLAILCRPGVLLLRVAYMAFVCLFYLPGYRLRG
jgi:hypothetical protein